MVLQYLFYVCITINISFLLFTAAVEKLPKCKENEFVYSYTQCTDQKRWRVAVPGKKCGGGKVEAPTTPYKCDTYCNSGRYMSTKSHDEKCADCPAGTFSLEGGIRFDDWEELPAGFETHGLRGEDSTNAENCTNYKWRAVGNYLEAPSGAHCSAVLSYTVTMAKKGHLIISYKYPPTDDNFFSVEVENEQCEVNSERGDYDGNWVPSTKADKWGQSKVTLSKGRNRVFFTLIDSGMNQRSSKASHYAAPSVYIRAMEVTGIAFTQSCSKCRAGTFSIDGATKCSPCEANQYSMRESPKCLDCPSNQYSSRGSSTCLPRPTCTKRDYYSFWTPCDPKTKKMSMQYDWIDPKVCVGGVDLPKTSGEYRKCDTDFCDKGMYRASAAACTPCPSGQLPINDGSLSTVGTAPTNASLACKKCPPDSQPTIGLVFTKWWTIPEGMKTACLSWRDDDENCTKSSLWIPMGDYIRSGYSERTFFSILNLRVPGFHNRSLENDHVGHIEFEFELNCKNKCKLFFMLETDHKVESPLISDWSAEDAEESKGKRKSFWYNIVYTSRTRFVWLFQRTTHNATQNDDHVKIFNINITNALNAPALACEPCHMGANKRCVPCKKGTYYSVKNKSCQSCPEGQVVWRTPARSIHDCRPCGPGMIARNGKECVIDFNFVSQMDGALKMHDLSPLKGNISAKGVHLFTTRSTEYHHVFVLSIDNQQAKNQYPHCQSNISALERSQPSVRALVCQYTWVPPRKKGGKSLTAQPLSLGDKLLNISSTDILTDPNHAIAINKRLEMAGWATDKHNMDIHLTYVTNVKSRNCPSGRTTLLTLRCDPKDDSDRGVLNLPPKCPEGTCDGCNYHFMWKTRHACPICNRTDYEVVVGQCSAGRQVLYYYPPPFCYFEVGKEHKKVTETRKCPLVSSEAEIGIIIVIILGVTLLTLLGYFWKRNKRLEYKYMKLVEGAGSRAGELPQAESCAVHEGEDDDEDVHIKSGGVGGSSAFFTRFKNFRKNNNHDDSMETVNLTDRDEFGL